MLHVLIPQIKIKPDKANRTYFPTTTDIQNDVYSAQVTWIIKVWSRKFKAQDELVEKELLVVIVTLVHIMILIKQIKKRIETLLYVHQEKWQAKLLMRYRNSIVLLDATSKTRNYKMPVFHCCKNQCCLQHCGWFCCARINDWTNFTGSMSGIKLESRLETMHHALWQTIQMLK